MQSAPDHLPPNSYRYEDLHPDVLTRVLRRRGDGIGNELNAVTHLLANDQVTMGDVSALLPRIETNVSLVHAAYYTDDECIDRIARWIAGKG